MTARKLLERKRRIARILDILTKLYPKASIALNYSTTWELLTAVALSAQCTDAMVNKVTTKLFKKYKTINDYACANPREMEDDVRQSGFYKNKANNLIVSAKRIQENYEGNVPNAMKELLTLPGVGRKTANVVLANAFNIVEGIAVDTHVRRFVIRFNLSDHQDPIGIEKDLMLIIPKREWNTITYKFIEYGRKICPARKHVCKEHPLTKIYPQASTRWPASR